MVNEYIFLTAIVRQVHVLIKVLIFYAFGGIIFHNSKNGDFVILCQFVIKFSFINFSRCKQCYQPMCIIFYWINC